MEVTFTNFYDLLPEIEKSIDESVFVAIDTELSGLNVSDEKDSYFDTIEERYDAVRRSSTQFLIVQFGLSTFYFDPETKEFTHKAFNFYTFPRQANTHGAPNIRFLCESSSLEFLASSGFDFNKWIYQGIPYVTHANREKMLEVLEKRHKLHETDDGPINVPENLKMFMHSTDLAIQAFLASSETQKVLVNTTAYQRKLIFHNLKPKYAEQLFFEAVKIQEYGFDVENEGNYGASASAPNLVSGKVPVIDSDTPPELETPEESDVEVDVDGNGSAGFSSESGDDEVPELGLETPQLMKPEEPNNLGSHARGIRILKINPAEQAALLEAKKLDELNCINDAVGFSRVIHKITESGKVVVGHNMLLDIAHTVHQFVEELPDNLAEFKTLVQTTFPNLIDTKYMASSHPFRELMTSTVLFDVVTRLQKEPFQLPKIEKVEGGNWGYEMDDKKRHEAGFDAYNTGVCFIGMCQYMGTLQTPKKSYIMADSPLVMPFLNKLYMMRMSDITYLNISGTDLTPSRSHVFYVTCPKDASNKNIQQIFSPFGNIQMCWRNPTSLFVSLNDKDQSSLVMKNIEYSSEYRIIPFATYQKLHREEKKRPLLNEVSPERPGDIFRKLVQGDKSPDQHKKKRPKTEKEKTQRGKTFDEPSWT